MVHMRPFAMIIFGLAGVAFAVAQDPGDLLKKYGPPDVERYRVNSDIAVTVAYGAGRTPCELLVQRRPSSILRSGTTTNPISSTVVDNLLSDLVPESTRHGTPKIMDERMGCAAQYTADYDNVRITRQTNECTSGSDEKVISVAVEWKTAQCTGD
jgi:hypothetical protein